jgi:hypothetical protein
MFMDALLMPLHSCPWLSKNTLDADPAWAGLLMLLASIFVSISILTNGA